MGSPSVLLPAFQTGGVLLFAEKDKWLWKECTFVRIFIVLLCVFREPAGKVEEFTELCFQEDICQVVAPYSACLPRGKGTGVRAGTSLSFLLQKAFEISVHLEGERKGQTHLHCRSAW